MPNYKVSNGSDPVSLREWRNRLIKARDLVEQRATTCRAIPTKCHHCALRMAGINQYEIAGVNGYVATTNWSLKHTRLEVLKMLNRSIRQVTKTLESK